MQGEGSRSSDGSHGGAMLASAGVGGHLPQWHLLGRAPHPGVARGGALVVRDTQYPHLLELGWFGPPLIVSINLSSLVVLPQSATLVGATDSPFLSWGHVGIPPVGSSPALGSPLVRVLSLQQMSPEVSALWSWVTGSILEWHPICMKSLRMSFSAQRSQYLPSPSGRVGLGPPGLSSVSPQCGTAWEPSYCHPKDLDLLQLAEHWWLEEQW